MDQIIARGSENKDWAKAPEGQHQGVLVDVIDLKMHPNVYMGVTKGEVHKCALVFQIDEINPDTGRRFELSREFTVSMGEKANLRKFLGMWRGKSYTDQEAEEGAPLHKLEGVNALIQVEHKQSKSNPDRSYANIVSVTESWLDYGQGEGPPRFGSPPPQEERIIPMGARKAKPKPSVKKQIAAHKNPRKRKGA